MTGRIPAPLDRPVQHVGRRLVQVPVRLPRRRRNVVSKLAQLRSLVPRIDQGRTACPHNCTIRVYPPRHMCHVPHRLTLVGAKGFASVHSLYKCQSACRWFGTVTERRGKGLVCLVAFRYSPNFNAMMKYFQARHRPGTGPAPARHGNDASSTVCEQSSSGRPHVDCRVWLSRNGSLRLPL